MSLTTTPINETLNRYIQEVGIREPDVLKSIRAASQNHALASMQVAPEQAQFLAILLKLMHANRVLEVGTFLGYSAAAFALSLGDSGEVVTCDIRQDWGELAKVNWQKAGVDKLITQRIGPAKETLVELQHSLGEEYFDFAFIDADKQNYLHYYELCLTLVRRGGLIAVDNTLWHGEVAHANSTDKNTIAIRQFNSFVHQDKRVDLCLTPVGDGCTLLRIQ